MSLRAIDASAAYTQALTRSPVAGGVDSFDTGVTAPGGFGAMITGLLSDTVAANRQAETASAKAVTGTSDIVTIASAVNNAEMTLETLVAVRDRMISAYQDIMRMPI
jgi:flagellar hook-basal body complex protein FliE